MKSHELLRMTKWQIFPSFLANTHFNYSFISANCKAYLDDLLDRKSRNVCSFKNINAPFADPGYSRWNM